MITDWLRTIDDRPCMRNVFFIIHTKYMYDMVWPHQYSTRYDCVWLFWFSARKEQLCKCDCVMYVERYVYVYVWFILYGISQPFFASCVLCIWKCADNGHNTPLENIQCIELCVVIALAMAMCDVCMGNFHTLYVHAAVICACVLGFDFMTVEISGRPRTARMASSTINAPPTNVNCSREISAFYRFYVHLYESQITVYITYE